MQLQNISTKNGKSLKKIAIVTYYIQTGHYMIQRYKELLHKYLPEQAVDEIYKRIQEVPTQLKITKSRVTKTGDYRGPEPGKNYHRISVNHDLNSYHFLITLIHELAHRDVFLKYGRKVKPHGVEWKKTFSDSLRFFVERSVFPESIEKELVKTCSNPKSSTYNETLLLKALETFNKNSLQISLEDIEENQYFQMKNGRVFRKKEKLRKYHKVIEIDSGKVYRMHGMAKIIPIKKPDNFNIIRF